MKNPFALLIKTGVTCKEMFITILTLLAINAIVLAPAVRLLMRYLS
jgi:hypothetical protein